MCRWPICSGSMESFGRRISTPSRSTVGQRPGAAAAQGVGDGEREAQADVRRARDRECRDQRHPRPKTTLPSIAVSPCKRLPSCALKVARRRTTEEFKAFPDNDWEVHVRAHTAFSSWEEMQQAAGQEWFARKWKETDR